jgi:hypothetical protein
MINDTIKYLLPPEGLTETVTLQALRHDYRPVMVYLVLQWARDDIDRAAPACL